MEGALAPWHLIIVAVLCLLFFGSKRLPDAARSLGQSLRIFKAEVRGLSEDVSLPPSSAQAHLEARRAATAPAAGSPPADSNLRPR